MRHARFQRAQLLQLLALFQRRRRQVDKARQRGAPEGIDADMVKQRPIAGRRARAGEIERPAPIARSRPMPPPASRRLDCRSRLRSSISAASVAISAPVACQRIHHCANVSRIERGQIALQIDHHIMRAVADRSSRSAAKHTVRTGRQIGDRSAPPCRPPVSIAVSDLRLRRGDDHRPDVRRHRLPPDAHDHRLVRRYRPSGLPGSRVEAMRAGMTTTGFIGPLYSRHLCDASPQ